MKQLATFESIRRIAPVTAIALVSTPAMARPGGDNVTLGGVVRDFHEHSVPGGHPDFEADMLFGGGHYAGNVAHELGDDGSPVFTGGGFKVQTQWQDGSGNNIAPHLYNAVWDNETDCGTVILSDSNGVDAYEISFVSVEYDDDENSTWTYHVRELETGKDLSHWNLALAESHVVMAGTTDGYDLGVDGSTGFYGIKWDVHESFSESDFVIVLEGHPEAGHQSAGVLAKGGNTADVDHMIAPIEGQPHATIVADESLNDAQGAPSMSADGGIQSADSFAQWYTDVPGVNLSSPLELTLVAQPDDTYVFDSDVDPLYVERGGFFPIDDQLFGNSDGEYDHNYHFTVELHAHFIYDEDAGQWFSFTGDDDVWVFINGKLVIDLGGVHSPIEQRIDISRAGLVDGELAKLDFFFAERHRTQSNFRIATNIRLYSSAPVVAVTNAFD